MDREEQTRLLAPSPEYLAAVKVFPVIAFMKKDVIKTIDTALSWESLTSADINFSVVRPLVAKYAKLKHLAAVYCALVVRTYFLTEAETSLAHHNLMISRADLCEIMAVRLLAPFASNYIELVAVLTTAWSPLAGAPPHVVNEVKHALGGDEEGMNYPQSALEMAISSEAKTFIASAVTQRVISDIYSGVVIFSTTSTRSIMADNYKPRSIELYDPRTAPFLDHYRLRVPRYGAYLEFLNFALLAITFVLCLATHDVHAITTWEIVFIIMATAFTLEEYTATKEHGWDIYYANMWNFFDTGFVIVCLTYLALRFYGLKYDHLASTELGFDILACAACILFPRLAFFAVSNNVVVLALRSMINEFIFFIFLASLCFSGLLFTLWTLADGAWSVRGIAWLMTQIWFGNTGMSFNQASSFHPLFGPILMTGFAALSNTLLLTILISILSNTFARIDENANEEFLFQSAIATIEGVKSDALFSYQPPFNLFAFLILKPCSFFLTPRALHTLNVFLIRLTSFPILICIALFERYFASGQKLRESTTDAAQAIINTLPRQLKNLPLLDALMSSSSGDLYEAIFEVEATHDYGLFQDSDDDLPTLRSRTSRESYRGGHGPTTSPPPQLRRPISPTPARKNGEPSTPLGSPRRLRVSTTHAQSPRGPDTSSHKSQDEDGLLSPLARLFTSRQTAVDMNTTAVDASMRRLEVLLEDVRDLPVQRLKEEMKELQDRQARIENLLLVLTRGMRGETSVSRHDSLA